MRKLFLMLVAAMCFIKLNAQNGTITLLSKSAAQQVCTNSSFTSFEAAFSFESIESTLINTEKGDFSQITMANTFPTGADGTPELPAARKLIAVPQGATPRVVVRNYTETQYKLSDYGIETLYPHQPSVSKSARPEEIKFVYDATAYAAKGFEDRPVAEVQVLGQMRGVRIGTLTVNPVIYNPATNSIIVRNNIELEVIFDGADAYASQSLYESTFNIHFNGVYRDLFNRDVYTDHPDLLQHPTKMLVIVADAYADALAPWIEWKTKVGIYMDVHYTSEAGSSYNAIKSFVHNKYNESVAAGNAITYLELVGDINVIPTETGSSSHCVTDLYYASVDGDYFPEMYYSRWAVSSAAEVTNMVEKSLCYEQVTTDPAYLGKALLIAGSDASWNPQVGQPAIQYASYYHFNEDHAYTDVYEYLNSYSGCYNNMNTGVAFANYTAHGSNTSWSNPSFTVSDVNNLTNVGKYFLAIGNCCQAADFGISGTCLAEAMTRAHQKAAYAYIGSCPSTYWYEDYYWAVGATNVYGRMPYYNETSYGVYDIMNWDTAFNVIGGIHVFGNLAVCYAHDGNYGTHSSPLYYWQSYHCFGDASIMNYCGLPTDNTVSHMAIFPIGLNTYAVTADPGSIVAISKDGVLHGTGVVDETGMANVTVDPILSGGNVDIVVTCRNKFPYTATVPAVALEGPYIVADAFELDGDGIFSYGETSGLSLTIKNVGADPSGDNVTVTLTTEDPLLTINTPTVVFDPINPDETQTKGGFVITASTEVENGHVFTIYVNATVGDDSWTSFIHVTAYKPILSLGSFLWAGSYEPGETLELTLTALNTGGFPVEGVEGTLTTTDEYVTINGATQSFGNIDVNGTASAIYSVTISDDCPLTEVIGFSLALAGDNGDITGEGTFTISNSCNLQFDLSDTYGDGWNNAALLVSFSDGSPSQSLTFSSGHEASFTIEVNSGTNVTLTWQSGSYDSECSFVVSYADSGIEIYSISHPSSGFLFEFIMDCTVQCAGVKNLVATAGGGGTMEISWSSPMGDVDHYDLYRDDVLIATTTATSYTDEGLEDGIYVYCVVVTFTDGCVGQTACVEGVCADMFNMPTSGTLEITTCAGLLYDDGGPNANYSNNCNGIAVIHPGLNGAMVHITGTYEVENNWDYIYIYDGESASGTAIGTYTGTGTLDVVSTLGALTVKFTSDGSVTKSGFEFVLACEGGMVSDIPGDANGDFTVNVLDITVAIMYMLGENPADFIFDNADVNADGIINILDVQLIVNIIFNNKYDDCGESETAYYIIEDGVFYISTPVEITAFMFNFDINDESTVTSLEALYDFQTATKIEDGKYTIIGYSLEGASIPEGRTPLFYVGDATLNDANTQLAEVSGCEVLIKNYLGINDVDSNFNVYPNPFNESVTINFEPTSNAQLVITNVYGQTINSVDVSNSSSYVWKPGSINNGIYFVTVKGNGITSKSIKLIYQK